jgi:arylsulfatase A-like enzyme
MLLTAALLDFEAIELSRQVAYAPPSGSDKILVLSYQLSVHLLFCLPLALLVVFGLRLEIASTPLRRTALLLSLLPIAVAATGWSRERVALPAPETQVRSATTRDMNVVLIVVDTLRADHLGSYGHSEETSPFIDSLAAQGVRFARCHAPASWTKPSVASLMTSLYPGQHGAVHFKQQLPDAVTTIAEIMAANGFVTYGYVANPNLKTLFNFDQGFHFYDDLLMRDRLSQATLRAMPLAAPVFERLTGRNFNFRDNDDIATALPRIEDWLEAYSDQNFFMYLHFMEPHTPYAPPAPYDTLFPGQGEGRRKQATRLYDGEIRYLDGQLQKLFALFERLDLVRNTLFILTSDHGEAFGEHRDWEHDHTVYQEQLHVPLILHHRAEPWSGQVVDASVRTIDIAPTVLDFAGIEAPEAMEGESLRARI